MGVQWFYGRGSDITGPVSGPELSGLAAAGDVLPTDTVWQEGVEAGVPAGRVRNLFRPPQAPAVTDAPLPDGAGELIQQNGLVNDIPAVADPSGDPAAAPAEAPAVGAPDAPTGWKAPPKTGRAVAGKGVTLIAQDGATVKYRGKCGTCGREDSSWKSIAIPRGTTRVGFFCPKCRKRRDGEIHGFR